MLIVFQCKQITGTGSVFLTLPMAGYYNRYYEKIMTNYTQYK